MTTDNDQPNEEGVRASCSCFPDHKAFRPAICPVHGVCMCVEFDGSRIQNTSCPVHGDEADHRRMTAPKPTVVDMRTWFLRNSPSRLYEIATEVFEIVRDLAQTTPFVNTKEANGTVGIVCLACRATAFPALPYDFEAIRHTEKCPWERSRKVSGRSIEIVTDGE